MHKFIKNRLKKVHFFLLLSFCATMALGMEIVTPSKKDPTVRSNRRSCSPDYTLSIFNPKDEFKNGTAWSKVVPESIKITPDSKGIVVLERGKVRQYLFEKDHQSIPRVIIEHISAKECFPLVAMAQKEDESLVVVSACNYKNKERKRVAECIVFCNDVIKKQVIDMPLQAISTDACGKRLAVAGNDYVRVIDVETDEFAEKLFKYWPTEGKWIVDIAMNPDGTAIVAAGNCLGEIHWLQVLKDKSGIKLDTIKKLVAEDGIRSIYYPNAQELFYVNLDSLVRSITIDNLFYTGNEHAKTDNFNQLLEEDIFLADHGIIAQVCWPKDKRINNKKFDEKEIKENASLISLKVLRKSSQDYKDEEAFNLEMQLPQERYNYITELGRCEAGVEHLLYVTAGKDHVVALATDGKLRVWDLPGKKKEKIVEKLELDSLSLVKQQKEGMSSKDHLYSPRKKKVWTSSDKGEKLSPREGLIQKFKKTSGSRENSPIRGKNSDEKK